MFTGHTFLVSPSTSALTVAALTQRGGCVVYDLADAPSITCAVVPNTSPCSVAGTLQPGQHLPSVLSGNAGRDWVVRSGLSTSVADGLRAARIPVVYELWVHQCLSEGHVRLQKPCAGGPDVIAYDPFLFSGVRFTTTQLPLQLKANIVAILQFHGAEYNRHLLDTTNTVIYSHMPLSLNERSRGGSSATSMRAASDAVEDGPETQTPPRSPHPHASSLGGSPPDAASLRSPRAAAASQVSSCAAPAVKAGPIDALSKLAVARARGVACVTPQWVQLCLNAGVVLPHSPLSAAAPLSRQATDSSRRKDGGVVAECDGAAACDGADTPQPHVDLEGDERERTEMATWVCHALDACTPLTPPTAAAKDVDGSATASPSANVSVPGVGRSRGTAAWEADPAVRAALRLADRLAANARTCGRKRRRHA